METTIEQLAPGVTYEPLYDGKIAAFTLTTVSRRSVDAWVDRVKGILISLPAGQTAFMIQDISDKEVGQTPYIRARLKEYQDLTPKRETYLGIVVGNELSSQIARMSTTPASVGENVHIQIFFRREEALDWLIGEVNRQQQHQ